MCRGVYHGRAFMCMGRWTNAPTPLFVFVHMKLYMRKVLIVYIICKYQLHLL